MDYPRTTSEISAAVKARQKPVDNSISLEAYFTTADHVGLQAKIYREEDNMQELFRILMVGSTRGVETNPSSSSSNECLERHAALCRNLEYPASTNVE